jgi:hypothetical protein
MLDLMSRGEIELAVFPNSVLAKLISAVNNGTAILVEPETLPRLRKNYYIKR